MLTFFNFFLYFSQRWAIFNESFCNILQTCCENRMILAFVMKSEETGRERFPVSLHLLVTL